MPETTPQPTPTTPAPQTVVPPVEQPKKGPGLLWLAIVLAVVILGGGAYFLYTKQQESSEKSLITPPSLVTQESSPNQGFGSSATSTPAVTPTLTSSDNVTDIEKDLSGTTIESGNSSEFDADLQSL